MGWRKYDPKNPPKAGQKIRCAARGENTATDGGRLSRGYPIDELDHPDWEIYWDTATELPPIGSIIQLAKWTPNQDWAEAVGTVVDHTSKTCARIEWTSFPKGRPTIEFGFPNDNVFVISTPTPKKGDRVKTNKDVATIKAGSLGTVIGKVDDGYLQVRFDDHTYSHSDHYHGCNAKELIVVQENKPLFKKGDRVRWINPRGVKSYTVDKWIGTVLEDYNGEGFVSIRYDQYKYCSNTDLHSQAIDEVVADATPTPAKNTTMDIKIAIGQVWRQQQGGYTVEIVAINGTSVDAKVMEPATTQHKVGDVRRDFGDVGSNGKVQWYGWDLIENTQGKTIKAALGQIWKNQRSGYTAEIIAINGTSVDVRVIAPGDSGHTEGTIRKGFGSIGVDGTVAWIGWDLVKNPEGKTMEAKIGQIWFNEKSKWKIQITGRPSGNVVSGRQIGDANGYKDGHHHTSFANPANESGYKMIQDVPKVGDIIRHCESGMDAILGKGKITSVETSSGIANIRFENYKYKGVSETHSYWLKDLVVEKEGKNMDKKEEKVGFVETFKQDAAKAAWRSAGTQLTNGVQAAILLMLKDKGADESKIAFVKEMMATEFGAILIRASLGYGLTYMPMVSDDPRVQKLAEEFRVSAIDSGMEQVMGGVMQYLAPAVMQAVSALPPIETAVPELLKGKKKHRVADVSDGEIEEEAEETAEPKTATA